MRRFPLILGYTVAYENGRFSVQHRIEIVRHRLPVSPLDIKAKEILVFQSDVHVCHRRAVSDNLVFRIAHEERSCADGQQHLELVVIFNLIISSHFHIVTCDEGLRW